MASQHPGRYESFCQRNLYPGVLITGHFMVDQNNKKTAVPTAKIKISELSIETQYTFFDSACL